MTWAGTWWNRYGSTVVITQEVEGHIEGRFRTALEISALYGQEVPIIGRCRGRLISFAAAGGEQGGAIIIGYTRRLADG